MVKGAGTGMSSPPMGVMPCMAPVEWPCFLSNQTMVWYVGEGASREDACTVWKGWGCVMLGS